MGCFVAFDLKLQEERRGGTDNAAGPREALTMEGFFDQAIKALGSTSRLVWIDDYEFLKAHQIPEAVPFIMPEGNDLGHTTIKNGKAISAGLAFRPLGETVKDTLAWWATVPEERRAKPRFIITPEIEAKALLDWKARGYVRATGEGSAAARWLRRGFAISSCASVRRSCESCSGASIWDRHWS